MKKLEIQLGLNTIKHLEEKSQYNCNYYELEPYGDWCIFFNGNNIIEENKKKAVKNANVL